MILKKNFCFILIFSTSLCCSCFYEEASSNIDYLQNDVNGIYENMGYSDATTFWGDAARRWIHRNEKKCPSCGVIFHGTCCPNSKCPLNQKDAEEKKDSD